jgi:hypothetical protein
MAAKKPAARAASSSQWVRCPAQSVARAVPGPRRAVLRPSLACAQQLYLRVSRAALLQQGRRVSGPVCNR